MSKWAALLSSDSNTDHYASAVPKARKGQALLPVDFHVFLSARQDSKLHFWDQGKSIFALFQPFQISCLRAILHVGILVPVYCVLCLWETHTTAVFSLPYFAHYMHSHPVLKAVSRQECRNCQKALFFCQLSKGFLWKANESTVLHKVVSVLSFINSQHSSMWPTWRNRVIASGPVRGKWVEVAKVTCFTYLPGKRI